MDAVADYGDSGSPVFRIITSGAYAGQAQVFGILRGGMNPGQRGYYYSDVRDVDYELGQPAVTNGPGVLFEGVQGAFPNPGRAVAGAGCRRCGPGWETTCNARGRALGAGAAVSVAQHPAGT